MLGKTHIAVGVATSFILLQPKTPTEFVIATVGGSIGGVMADIDVKVDKSNEFAKKASMDAPYGQALALSLSACSLLTDHLLGGGIVSGIVGQGNTSLIGMAMLVALIVLGKRSTHRDRTHSILALILSTFAVAFIEVRIGVAYSIGYATHLLIDLLNKSGIRLLFPLKKTFCLKRCYADRLGNELLLILGICVIVSYTLLNLAS